MSIVVLDASISLAWCFEDEITPEIRRLFERFFTGDIASVPAHWPLEVANGFLFARRKNRIPPGRTIRYWDQFSHLPIHVEPPLDMTDVRRVSEICEKHGLTAYDGAYLDLAIQQRAELGTLDKDIVRAAKAEGVTLA